MKGHEMQFGPEDVTRKLREVHDSLLCSKYSFLLEEISHSIRSPSMGILGPGHLLLYEKESGFIEDNTQRAQVKDLYNSTLLLNEYYTPISSLVQHEHFLSKKFNELTALFCRTLEDLVSQLSMCELLLESGTLNELQEECLSEMVAYAQILVYSANRLFSPEFHRDKYYLDKDMKHLRNEFRPALAREGIILEATMIDTIVTTQDYVAHAVLPLVLNAREHAFNPANDIYARMSESEFTKQINLRGFAEHSGSRKPAESGLYFVGIKDNGFGIRPELLEHLFEKGATAKEHDGTQHGIGLWGVKQFVERNGGTISVETELGKGTRFEFSIPYSHLESFVCVQAQPSE